VRRALLSVTVGLAGAAGVTASAWALQTVALPPPTPADRIAADASTWFHEYRLVVDVFHVDRRTIKGACLHGWFHRSDGQKVQGSLLSFRAGPRVFVSGARRTYLAAGSHRRFMPNKLAAAAGCSGELAPILAAAAQNGAHLTTARDYAAGQPVIELRIERVHDERITLDVSPRTYRPLVAVVLLEGETATARLYLNRVSRPLLTRFHLLHVVVPTPSLPAVMPKPRL
jgi:hypothetical protein